jgi:hypothetical protein
MDREPRFRPERSFLPQPARTFQFAFLPSTREAPFFVAKAQIRDFREELPVHR